MSIDYGSAIVVGLGVAKFDEQQLEKWFDDDLLESFYPCFDEWKDAICGIAIYKTDWWGVIDHGEMNKRIDDAYSKFKEVTGMDGQLYLMLDVR